VRILLFACLALGCANNGASSACLTQVSKVDRESLRGEWTYTAVVIEADPALGIAVGTTTEARLMEWTESDDWLAAVSMETRYRVHALYRIGNRFALDESCRIDPDGAPRWLRIDWSTELSADVATELGLGALEPISIFISDEDIPFFAIAPPDSIAVVASYATITEPSSQLRVQHRFVRLAP
jgi:hypothetical protein